MFRVQIASHNDFADWRMLARALLQAAIPPEQVVWQVPGAAVDMLSTLFSPVPEENAPVGNVSRSFLALAEAVVQHSAPERFSLLYTALWQHQRRQAVTFSQSQDLQRTLTTMASAVRRDAHKMKAFVRFRSVQAGNTERFLAWFEPDHFTLEPTAPFFARRFAGMHWAIITPYASAVWDTETLRFGAGGKKSDIPDTDAIEEDWRTYFSAIFNPARLKVSMMKSEMPMKYWRNLPEASEITPLIRGAQQSERDMIARAASQPPARHLRRDARTAAVPVPEPSSPDDLADLTTTLQGCRRCPLHQFATQPVPGEGSMSADVMFVGEQPGDEEDLSGRPFVGPAGQVFQRGLDHAGIVRSRIYVTNAVKHFKFEPRGKRRIHQRPNSGEVQSCRFWLDHERRLVAPRIIVALGNTAAHAILGKAVAQSELRGRRLTLADGTWLFVTNHPSYVLRIPGAAARVQEEARFFSDLALIRQCMDQDLHH